MNASRLEWVGQVLWTTPNYPLFNLFPDLCNSSCHYASIYFVYGHSYLCQNWKSGNINVIPEWKFLQRCVCTFGDRGCVFHVIVVAVLYLPLVYILFLVLFTYFCHKLIISCGTTWWLQFNHKLFTYCSGQTLNFCCTAVWYCVQLHNIPNFVCGGKCFKRSHMVLSLNSDRKLIIIRILLK